VDNERELEVIREQMDQTRASLADKIEALESQVLDTVHDATETVSSAVEGAKEVVNSVSEGAKEVVGKVSETFENVKESLSVRRYVEQYPWVSMGVAVAAGFTAAQLVPTRRTSAAPARSYSNGASQPAYQQERSSWTSALSGVFHTAASTLESLAVGTLMAGLKELAVKELPQEWQTELNRLVDETTNRLGGKVMQGNPLQELFSSFQRGDGEQDTADDRARV
jgi:ElaB/YqjD/DUF883 family membrane-anchored ribosome-binding protein